eukprot:CAMPEP_0177746426 /NCGR_PEP_ID=MMETSP0484_2-20121128/30855_1 /TAXON_ID=354590 /ORGANISM="Rhodomonas lens, Strain RHODO" /LENGTH=360 /DNA_ID=CAMNT_0019261159 /DNA_START=326 /DNA_END=1405 /DNA_ORIENTATION=+
MASMLTISKRPGAKWEAVLPAVLEALGGASEEALIQLLLATRSSTQPAPSSADTPSPTSPSSTAGQVQIRMQVLNKIPNQIEAIGFLGTSKRVKLPLRFAESMALLMGDGGGGDFFAKRKWVDRGTRYPDVSEMSDAERELAEITQALATEVEEIEAAYPPRRLQSILAAASPSSASASASSSSSSSASASASSSASSASASRSLRPDTSETSSSVLDIEAVDLLCDSAEAGDDRALETLAVFVSEGKGTLAARRTALAFLGGTGGRGGEQVVEAILSALENEKTPAMRRTAGDALSDLGDPHALPRALSALQDPSQLVRWRAGRLLGELACSPSTLAALQAAAEVESAFEVGFELKDAI